MLAYRGPTAEMSNVDDMSVDGCAAYFECTRIVSLRMMMVLVPRLLLVFNVLS